MTMTLSILENSISNNISLKQTYSLLFMTLFIDYFLLALDFKLTL